MSMLDDVATYLAAQSTALTVLSGSAGNLAKAISLDHTPAPDTLVSLYETGGFAPAHAFTTASTGSVLVFEQPSLQCISRSSRYATARTNAQTVFDTLDGYAGSLPTATGVRYLSIAADQSPFSIGRDKNDRFLVSVNFTVRKEVT